MAVPVLIVTPTTAFGELIRQKLEEDGHYRAMLVEGGCEALEQIQTVPFAPFELAILDSDIEDIPLLELAKILQKIRPDLRLIIVPPNNDPNSPALAGLSAHGYLTKPFYLPDFMDIVVKALPVSQAQNTPVAPVSLPSFTKRPPSKPLPSSAALPASAPAWLQDVNRAAQHLTRLSLETAAQAAMIVRGSQLWAYAGQLPQPAAQELVNVLANYWTPGSDLARFVHLQVTEDDYMLYATSLGGDMALALVFDVEIPFNKIRTQASHLARALASPPSVEAERPSPQVTEKPEGEEPINLTSIQPLFDDVPPSIPNGQLQSPLIEKHTQEAVRPLPSEGEGYIAEPSPATRLKVSSGTPQRNVMLPELAPAPSPEVEASPAAAETMPEFQAETHPKVVFGESQAVKLEPVSLAVYHLNYACLLIPRMPHHHITGDLADRLSEWVTQLCLAYGWRLEQLSVRPDYLQWVVNVPPTTSPSYLMRVLRQQTSQHIFTEFPTLAHDNPSGDFWAPGYLIMSSSQSPPSQVVADFIKQTRHQQGVTRPSPDQRRISK